MAAGLVNIDQDFEFGFDKCFPAKPFAGGKVSGGPLFWDGGGSKPHQGSETMVLQVL
jgi:hypothetical protein